jgi:hypothetical protein
MNIQEVKSNLLKLEVNVIESESSEIIKKVEKLDPSDFEEGESGSVIKNNNLNMLLFARNTGQKSIGYALDITYVLNIAHTPINEIMGKIQRTSENDFQKDLGILIKAGHIHLFTFMNHIFTMRVEDPFEFINNGVIDKAVDSCVNSFPNIKYPYISICMMLAEKSSEGKDIKFDDWEPYAQDNLLQDLRTKREMSDYDWSFLQMELNKYEDSKFEDLKKDKKTLLPLILFVFLFSEIVKETGCWNSY